MKARFGSIFNKITVRIVFLVLSINILVAIGFYFFVLRPITSNIHSQIIASVTEHTHDIYSICYQSDIELLRMGYAEDALAVNVKKGYTLGMIESYMIRNDISVIIMQDNKIILTPDSLAGDPSYEIYRMLWKEDEHKVEMLDYNGAAYYSDSRHFDPWGWNILILKNASLYTALTQNMILFYVMTLLLLLTGASLLLYYLNRVINVPLKSIISKLQHGELPDYRGTQECEYLSDNMRDALKQVRLKADELENVNAMLMKEISERIKTEDTLRKSEELFRTIVESATDAIFILDAKGNIGSWPGAASEMFGYQPEEVIGRPVSMLVPDELREEQRSVIEKVLGKGETIKNHQTLRIKKDGTVFPVEITSNPMKDDHGNVTGICGIVRDITDRDKLEKQLLQAQKIEAIGQLAGGIAHDFNNLLTSIVSNVYLSKMCIEPGHRAYKRLETTESALMKAGSLTQQLLTFSKGGAPVKKVMSLAIPIYETARFALSGSNVSHEIDIQDGLWHVEADEGQISRVIHNMIMNADQSMPEGGVVRISAENLTIVSRGVLDLNAGRYVKITIYDEGVGIPEEHLEKIFDPYFTTKQKGSGLGLAVCYSIIKKHGGLISAESKTGSGSSLSVYLPASGEVTDSEEKFEKRLIHGKGRILLMDDDELLRKSVGDMLNVLGYEVDFAVEGAEAIHKYREAFRSSRPFDAVIMDLTVPGGMGGRDAVKELMEIDPDIIAIVASGYSDSPVMAHFREYGFKEVLSKPYDPEQMSRILKMLLKDRGV